MTAATRYAAVRAVSAGPDDLVVELHARAVADLRHALVHLRAGRARAAQAELRHARRVFLFLNRVLDPHAAPRLAGDLHATYRWALRELAEGDARAIRQVLLTAERLHRAWATLTA